MLFHDHVLIAWRAALIAATDLSPELTGAASRPVLRARYTGAEYQKKTGIDPGEAAREFAFVALESYCISDTVRDGAPSGTTEKEIDSISGTAREAATYVLMALAKDVLEAL